MAEYRIDELAREAGTTVRNVRAYRQRGLLPPGRRHGRAGVFDESHLARLRLVGQLLERGYTLANIAELIAAWENGHGLEQLFGYDIPEYVTAEWLAEHFAHLDTDELPGALDHALELGIVEVVGDRFRVLNPGFLSAAAELAAAGVPPRALADHARSLQADVEHIARRFVDMFDEHVFQGRSGALPTPEEAREMAQVALRLRRLADMVVLGELRRALDTETRRRLQQHLDRLLP